MEDENPPLYRAVKENRPDIAKLLLNEGAIADYRSDTGETLLGIAFREVNLPMIELLLQHGADPYASDPDMGATIDNIPPELDEDTSEKIFSLIEKYKKPA